MDETGRKGRTPSYIQHPTSNIRIPIRSEEKKLSWKLHEICWMSNSPNTWKMCSTFFENLFLGSLLAFLCQFVLGRTWFSLSICLLLFLCQFVLRRNFSILNVSSSFKTRNVERLLVLQDTKTPGLLALLHLNIPSYLPSVPISDEVSNVEWKWLSHTHWVWKVQKITLSSIQKITLPCTVSTCHTKWRQ